jgi:hypothetical protein
MALATALGAGSTEKPQVAAAITEWACSPNRVATSSAAAQVADSLLVAVQLDPTLAAAYRELANIMKAHPDAVPPAHRCRQAYERWRLWLSSTPPPKLDAETAQAGAFLALRSSDPVVAAQLDPALGEAQFLAALRLLGVDDARSSHFARQAYDALGARADTRVLLAACGLVPPLAVEPLPEITPATELIRYARLIGGAGGELYVLHGASLHLVSRVSIETGAVTPLATDNVGQPALSPDGTALLHVGGECYLGPGKLTITDLASGKVTFSAETIGPLYAAVWHWGAGGDGGNDGTTETAVAVSTHEGLIVVSPGAGAATGAGAGPGTVAAGARKQLLLATTRADRYDRIPLVRGWAAGGSELVFQWLYREVELLDSTGRWVDGVYCLNLATGAVTPLGRPEAWEIGVGEMLFQSGGGGVGPVACAVGTDLFQMGVLLCDLAGDVLEPVEVVADGGVYAFPLQWSPDSGSRDGDGGNEDGRRPGRWLLLAMAPSMPDRYDQWYSSAIRQLDYPPYRGLNGTRYWIYDTESGELALLPVPSGVETVVWHADGSIYYFDPSGAIRGLRVTPANGPQ